MGKFIDLTGQRFGRLTVLEMYDHDKLNQIRWMCQCECGNKKVVLGGRLRSGTTQSCGCLQKELLVTRSKTNPWKKHNKSYTKIYKVYHAMKHRCFNPNNKFYKYYGARGITVCQEWLDDFMNFYNWAIENGYQEGLTIDRIDVNGNYEPSNCRWTNASIQGFNRQTQSNNTSGYTGVSKLKNGRYVASIKKDKKQIHLGVFDKIEDAIEARKKAEKELYK